MNRWSIVVAMGFAAVVGCSDKPGGPETTKNPPPPASTGATTPIVDPGHAALAEPLTVAERDEFYHLPEGGELLPLDMLRAVESTRTFKPFFEDLERFRLIPDPNDPDGLPVGMAAAMIDGKRAEPRMVFFNCAACHTAEITYSGQKIRLDGVAAHFDMASFVAELLESTNATLTDPKRLAGFLERLAEQKKTALKDAYPDLKLKGDKKDFLDKMNSLLKGPNRIDKKIEQKIDDLKLRVDSAKAAVELLQDKIKYLEGLRGLRPTTIPGFGRLDAFVGSRNLLFGEQNAIDMNSPVSLPSIHGLSKLSWYHYDNNTTSVVQRNIGQDLGVGAVANTKTGESTVKLRNLLRLETLASKIAAPKWPDGIFGAIDTARATRGGAIYQKECASCHDYGPDGIFPDRMVDLETIGTDPNRALNFTKAVGNKTFPESLHEVIELVQNKSMADENVTAAELAKFERSKIEWRETKKYAARPMKGIWASAPYLHNGSVPTLHDLLLPPDKRPKSFQMGSREFDPKKVGFVHDGTLGGSFQFDTTKSGNLNTGHTYGTTLSEEERLDLLEYLKGL